MMVELMAPGPDDVICDPACGTSGFLVASGEYLKEKYKEEIFFNREKKAHYMNNMFHGYDTDRTMLAHRSYEHDDSRGGQPFYRVQG